MILKKIILLISVFFIVFKGLSQDLKIIDTLQIHEQIKQFGINKDVLNFGEFFFSDIIFKNDSTLFYNPNGTLHLFEIQLSEIPKVSKLSNSIHHGHNFNRLLFIHDDVLYSFGGQGLFNTYAGLVYFDPILKGWLEREIKNYPHNAKRILNSWIQGSKLMLVLGYHSRDPKNIFSSKKNNYCYGEIDLENLEFTKHLEFKSAYTELLFQSDLGFFKGNYRYDSELYSLHGYYTQNGSIEYRLFDKSKGSLKRTSQLDGLKRVDGISYAYIKDSTIYYRDFNGKIESFSVHSGTTIHSKDFLKHYKSKKTNTSPYLIIAFIIFLLMLGFIYSFSRKRKIGNNTKSNVQIELIQIEEKLKQIQPTIIVKEELDVLFGISHYSYETIKTRRSLLINQLNKKGNIKIERIRKQDDKRFYEYKIS